MSYTLITSPYIGDWPLQEEKLLALDYWVTWRKDISIINKYNLEQAIPFVSDPLSKIDSYNEFWCVRKSISNELFYKLNQYHNVNYSYRYWNILVGPWLNRFLSLFYQHWYSIHKALIKYDVSRSIIKSYPPERLISSSFHEFAKLHRLDSWSEALYGDIIKNYTDIKTESIFNEHLYKGDYIDSNRFVKSKIPNKKLSIKNVLVKLIYPFSKYLTKSKDALIITSYLPFWEEVKLNLLLGQFPVPRLRKEPKVVKPDLDLRSKLSFKSEGKCDFLDFIKSRIFFHIPTSYLEGYKLLKKSVDLLPWPSKPSFIYTCNSFEADEFFKLYTAEKVESGYPYIIGQHGGNYGVAKYLPSEVHERESSDCFLTWGWCEDVKDTIKSSFSLHIGRNPYNFDPNGDILLVQKQGIVRYELWDTTFEYKEYLDNQIHFVNQLTDDCFKNLIVRLPAIALMADWSLEEIWRENFNHIRIDDGYISIFELVKKARISIFSFESTGFLEHIYFQIPTMMFYSEDHYPRRSEVNDIYQLLSEVGLLHSNPESAAKFLNNIWDDIDLWWNSKEVRYARNLYSRQFTRMSNKPIKELKNILLSCNSRN